MFRQKCRFRLLDENTKKQFRVKNDQFFGFCWRFIDFFAFEKLGGTKTGQKRPKPILMECNGDKWMRRRAGWLSVAWFEVTNWKLKWHSETWRRNEQISHLGLRPPPKKAISICHFRIHLGQFMTFSMTVLKLRFFPVFALPSPFWGEISFETFHFQRRESGTEKQTGKHDRKKNSQRFTVYCF